MEKCIPIRPMAICLIFSIAFGLINECQAQKCVLLKNEIDKFTNNRVLKTGYYTISSGFRVSLSRVNEFTYLDLVVAEMQPFSVNDGNELIILFADNSKLVLKNIRYVIADIITSNRISVWNATTSFGLTDKDINQLEQKAVQAIRVYTNDGYLEGDIKSKHKLTIKSQLECLKTFVK